MRRADIIAGSAFRTAALAVVIMAAAFIAAGGLAHKMLSHTLYFELERELFEEIQLFMTVDKSEGMPGLVEAVEEFESPEIAGNRFVALIDLNGELVAGNLGARPGLLELNRQLTLLKTADGREIAVSSARIETAQLVVGQDTALVKAALHTLTYALSAAFVVIAIAVMLAGWVLSRQSLAKLTRIADTLEQVGRGDMSARIGLPGKDGQIDRIAKMIDLSLGQLAALAASSQNTIRAIAHDLRTPLGRTMMRIEDAAAAPANKRDQLLAEARNELDRLGAIFDTVLRISTLETSYDPQMLVEVDLAAIVRETVPLFEADLDKKRQTVEIVTETPVDILGDDQALRQLLVNLLANSNRYAGQGARITVRAARDGDGAVLSVCDNGPGIPQDQRDEVMKPFARLDASRSVDGTGLGLALANAIAFRHGATIELDDHNPGLCVHVRFPGY